MATFPLFSRFMENALQILGNKEVYTHDEVRLLLLELLLETAAQERDFLLAQAKAKEAQETKHVR